MNTRTQAGRLAALKRSLEAAQRTQHASAGSLTGEHRAQYDGHVRGQRAGLQVAINAIESELLMIAAGERAAAVHAQPE